MNQIVIIIDFGGQYSQVIARKMRECHVYCEVVPWQTDAELILKRKPIGLVLSGGPASVYDENAPTMDKALLKAGIPVLGICYGCQLMVKLLGGEVSPAQEEQAREYGRTETDFDPGCPVFEGLPEHAITWMSHGDSIRRLPEGFAVIAKTEHCPNAGIVSSDSPLYGLQFHPEVKHTDGGLQMIENFLYRICHAEGDWRISHFCQQAIQQIQAETNGGTVLLALSGGVDSAITAALIYRAIGQKLHCIYVDHGLMRKGESDEIEWYYSRLGMNFHRVSAENYFLSALRGVTDPEEKRKIIGATFADVFTESALELGGIDYLAQGTIYPDVIESGAAGGQTIKSHHNVGGLPKHLQFKGIIEPLRFLFKDEVRALGTELGVPDRIIHRQPFPGPGLGVRIIGEITREKLSMLQKADAIFRSVLEESGSMPAISQAFAVLTDTKSVGVMGDSRTYEYTLALRAVSTDDYMTADFVRIPWPVLEESARRIVNEVPGINRVVYDITSKPPSTVEWE